MAFKKEFEVNDTGFSAEYVRIEEIVIFRETGKDFINVRCGLYKDQASRDAGKKPITEIHIKIDNDDMLSKVINDTYNKMKAMKEFEGALDV